MTPPLSTPLVLEGEAKHAAQERIIDALCEGITLSEVCRQEGMPKRRTVYDWIRDDAEFAKDMDRAREIGCDALADQKVEIADDASNDWMKRHGKDGKEEWVLNGEHVQRSKLRIWTRDQLIAKWHPKKYGEKIVQEHTGPNGGPVLVQTTPTDEAL